MAICTSCLSSACSWSWRSSPGSSSLCFALLRRQSASECVLALLVTHAPPPSRMASNLLLQPCELSVNPPRFHGNQSETWANYVLLFISQTAPRFVWWLNSETVKVMQRGTLSSSCWFTAQCFTATCVCPPTLLNGQGPLQRGARQLRVVVGAIKSQCTLEEPLSE